MVNRSALLVFAVLAGCAKPVVIPPALIAQEDNCFVQVAEAQIAMAAQTSTQQRVTFDNETNYILALAIEKLGDLAKPADVSPFLPCTVTVNAYLRENGAIARSNNAIVSKAVGAVAVVGGIVAGGNALEGVLNAGVGASTSTITNSRVVSDSGNDNTGSSRISSSGETLNLGNVEAVNESQSQGGIQPRQTQANEGALISEAASQSGTNADISVVPGSPVSSPIEAAPVPVIAPETPVVIQPVQLPVE